MSVDKLPSGMWRARLQIDGRRHVASFQTRQQALESETITRAQGIQGADMFAVQPMSDDRRARTRQSLNDRLSRPTRDQMGDLRKVQRRRTQS